MLDSTLNYICLTFFLQYAILSKTVTILQNKEDFILTSGTFYPSNPLIATFAIHLIHHSESIHVTKMRTPIVTNYFGYLLNGSASFITPKECVSLHAQELIFIPNHLLYQSVWRDETGARFYSIPFTFIDEFKMRSSGFSYRLQKVTPPENSMQRLATIYAGMSKKGADEYVAIGQFYQWLSEILPHLRAEQIQQPQSPILPAIQYLQENLAAEISVAHLATLCHKSESGFYSAFRNATGFSPITYRNRLRIREACVLLTTSEKTIEEISEKLGFFSAAYFRRQFEQIIGVPPSAYRRNYSI